MLPASSMAMSNHETPHVASVFTALHVGSMYEDSLDPEIKNFSMDFWIYQPEQKASNVVDHETGDRTGRAWL